MTWLGESMGLWTQIILAAVGSFVILLLGVHAGDQLGDGSGVPAVRPLEHVLYAIVNDRDEPTGGGACRVCGRILWTRVRGSLPTMSRPCTGPPGLSVWR